MKKRKILISISLIILSFLVIDFYFEIAIDKESNALRLLPAEEEKVIKKSPYTLEELYSFTIEGNWPADSYVIYENWYDYFSQNTSFINKYGEAWNYEEYMYLKDKFLNNFFPQVTDFKYGEYGEDER